MDNQDWDKIFGEKLNQTRSFEYNDQDWKSVESRLPTPSNNRLIPIWWQWILPAVSGMALLFFAMSFFKNQHEITQLNQTIKENEIQETDTVFIEKIIYKTDTIIETKVEKVYVIQSDFKNINSSQSQQNFLNNFVKKTVPNNSSLESDFIKNQSADYLKPNEKILADFSSTTGLAHLPLLEVTPVFYQPDIKIENRFHPVIQPVKNHFLQPKIKLWGTWATIPNYSLEDEERTSFIKKNAWQIGIANSWKLGDNWQVNLEFGYQKINFQASGVDSLTNINPLIPLPESYNYYLFRTLDNIDISQTNLQYGLSLDYYFQTKNNICPFLSLGVLAKSRLRQAQENEWTLSGGYIEETVQLDTLYTDSGFKFNALRAGIGVEGQINQYIGWQLEGQYFYTPSNTYQMNPKLGLRASLFYQFLSNKK